MGEYITKKSEMRFQSIDSLNSVITVINEAEEALNDKNRTIATSSIPELLAPGVLAGIGAGGVFAGLVAGVVGGVVGLGFAAPVALVAAVGAGIAKIACYKSVEELREAKETCYKDAVAKQNAIIKALKQESKADKERIEYLNSLNTLLTAAVRDLKHDLGYA